MPICAASTPPAPSLPLPPTPHCACCLNILPTLLSHTFPPLLPQLLSTYTPPAPDPTHQATLYSNLTPANTTITLPPYLYLRHHALSPTPALLTTSLKNYIKKELTDHLNSLKPKDFVDTLTNRKAIPPSDLHYHIGLYVSPGTATLNTAALSPTLIPPNPLHLKSLHRRLKKDRLMVKQDQPGSMQGGNHIEAAEDRVLRESDGVLLPKIGECVAEADKYNL